MVRRLTLAAVAAFFMLAVTASSADTFQVRLVSETSKTLTIGWDPQSGYGYLFSADGTVVSRTNDAARSSVKFAKGAGSYEVAVITKGATGTYPPSAPPPPPPPPPPAVACADGADNDADGKVDLTDPGCSSSADTDETDPTSPPPPPPSTGFPDASNTGVPAGTTLTAYAGPSNITAANTVISGKTMGSIQVSAPGVTIRNSRINGTVTVDDRSFTDQQTPLLIEDSEIVCQGGGGTGVEESDFIVRRVEITKCENGFSINQNALIEDSYIHDLYNSSAAHADGAQLSFGHWNGSSYPCCARDVTFRHNTMYGMGDGDTTFGTSAIISNPRGDVNILIENNLMAGGAYTLYCDYNGTATNYRVIDNHFSTRFKATVGFYGVSTGCSDETQSGNVIHETGQPITLG